MLASFVSMMNTTASRSSRVISLVACSGQSKNSGLVRPLEGREHATKEMTRLDLEAVVFIIDTNDANMMPRLDDDAVTEDGTNWRVDYRARVNLSLIHISE